MLASSRPTIDQCNRAYVVQLPENLLPPRDCTFRSWWKVSRLAGSGKAESHWQYRNAASVIEVVARDPHPLAKTVATGVGERNARLVHFATGRLTDQENPCFLMQLENRAWRERQLLRTDGAIAYLGE